MRSVNPEPQTPQPPYPLHESVKDKLDPEYVEFYNKYIINNQQVHYQPVAASRTGGTLIPGGGPAQPVGKTEDFAIKRVETEGPDVMVRCFTPVGETPEGGWPVMIYYHGGGWVLGNINTENVVCSHLCKRANCVITGLSVFSKAISTLKYSMTNNTVPTRLAPEDPFPAAVHDSWEAVLWATSPIGQNVLKISSSKIAIGGSSAGGNLAAIMCHKAARLSNPIVFKTQLLIVPVTDNTASPTTNATYLSNENTAALPAVKMLWYRRHYLPNESDWVNPEASPLLYADHWDVQPKALVLVGELDVLRQEGEDYASKLQNAGVEVDLKVMKGMPHPFLAMDGSLQAGRDAITYMCEALKSVF
ncbi:AB hydrolase superfamily protein [Lachnellula hyalina]|uniref:AB hydrolase superfamily protein n=1 Tax=Lachnellula hyalina TaxID=1316788 RepID=A0A8H8R2X2_9HELO|nr:AB hydrolase superfamily protein [Lachnellula hyalina]TVY27061.1 AB hydrolase superfamily protein [Lachnellula hyalina]